MSVACVYCLCEALITSSIIYAAMATVTTKRFYEYLTIGLLA